jgi:Tfp pilus assembly protein PilV
VTALERLLVGLLASVVLLSVGTLAVRTYGAHRYDAGRAAAIAERAQADAAAVLKRTRENTATAAQQAASNATITEKKHEEIQPVRERIVTRRVYVGSALCGDRPAVTAEAEGAAGSDSADPPGRLVRPDVERDLVALKLAVEEDLATGRACQAVLKDEGMVP